MTAGRLSSGSSALTSLFILWLRLSVAFAAIATLTSVHASPALLTQRQSITSLSSAQIASYKPSSFYASAGYCDANATLSWSCGTNCDGNPGFKPVASGGDGVIVQFWFVGYDTALDTVVVSHQGTHPEAIIPLLIDADFGLVNLDSVLFPGVDSSIQVHHGFAIAHTLSAPEVLQAVQATLKQHNTRNLLLTGHSLGAAISLLHTVYLPLHIPNLQLTYVGYGLPRVGNQAFADHLDAHAALGLASVTHINNRADPVPIIPGRNLGFHQPAGEIHIQVGGAGVWLACPGQDNPSAECEVGAVPNIFEGDLDDHDGPYGGVRMACD